MTLKKQFFLLIPNNLTRLRILLVLPIALLILAGQHLFALSLFVLAAISDTLDGYFARRYKRCTVLGSLLDPIADKFLIVTLFFCFSLTHQISLWLAICVIAREFIMILAISYLVLTKRMQLSKLKPSLLGKLTTVVQILFVFLVFTQALLTYNMADIIFFAERLLIIVLLFSSAEYLIRAIQDISVSTSKVNL